MVILERGWRRERIRLGEKTWLKQQHGIWRGRISTPRQTASGIRGPIHEQAVVYATISTDGGSIPGPQQLEEGTREGTKGWRETREGPGKPGKRSGDPREASGEA